MHSKDEQTKMFESGNKQKINHIEHRNTKHENN